MICFAPLLIQILLTEDFLILKQVIRVFAFSVFFKALAYPMGYISFAKGDKKTFFWLEGIYGNTILTLTSILFYHFWGLIGLAIALVITYIIFVLTYIVITKKLYSYMLDRTVTKLLLITGLLTSACFISSLIDTPSLSYLLMGIWTICSIIISLVGLERRLNIFKTIREKLSFK